MTNQIRHDVVMKRKIMQRIQSSLGTKISDTLKNTVSYGRTELPDETTNHVSKEKLFHSNVDKLLQAQ
jgi:hypothetical protein